MATQRSSRWVLLVGFLIAFHPCAILAQEAGRSVVKRGVIAEDLYVAGGKVDILAEVDGDVVAVGGRMSIGQLVQGDVVVAGGAVSVKGQVLDDVRVAGGTVTIGAHVGGDVVAVAGDLSLLPESDVAGKAWLTGGTIEIGGSIGKELKASAGHIRLAGQVGGDVHLAARHIEILPTARIKGDLIYRSSRSAKIDPAAQIEGQVTHHPIELAEKAAWVKRAIVRIGGILFLLGLMAAGIVLFLLFSNFTLAAARTIGSHPWYSLGLGFALLVSTPIAACLLIITIVGMPLGLTVCALYAVALLLGFLTTAFFLGDLGSRLLRRGPELSKGWRVLSLIVAILVLGLLWLTPIAGTVILLFVLLFGLGAWSIHGYQIYASSRP